jgi:hypothetical protein
MIFLLIAIFVIRHSWYPTRATFIDHGPLDASGRQSRGLPPCNSCHSISMDSSGYFCLGLIRRTASCWSILRAPPGGIGRETSALEAAIERVWLILMTTFAAILGPSHGHGIRRGWILQTTDGSVHRGGLIVAQILTLCTPVFYVYRSTSEPIGQDRLLQRGEASRGRRQCHQQLLACQSGSPLMRSCRTPFSANQPCLISGRRRCLGGKTASSSAVQIVNPTTIPPG